MYWKDMRAHQIQINNATLALRLKCKQAAERSTNDVNIKKGATPQSLQTGNLINII